MLKETEKHRIVIVGGGVAGLEIASALGRHARRSQRKKDTALAITLVDRDAAHVWKPMLHTIAAGTRELSQHQTTYLAQARNVGFSYQPGTLCGLDRAAREVLLSPLRSTDGRLLIPAQRLAYDTLILALGSQANDFGTPGVAEHCFKIDSRQQADRFNQEMRIHMLQCLSQNAKLSIAIVGGGATGVELAAELVQLTQAFIGYGIKDLTNRVKITLIESGPRLLAAFPPDISSATQTRLEALGIRIKTDAHVQSADASGFVLSDGRIIAASLRVWAAGIKAPDFLGQLDGLESNTANQLLISASLQTTQDDNIYAIGDCASLTLPPATRPLPATAQVAHQQALHVIRHLPMRLCRGVASPAFVYRDQGALVSLGDYDAYGLVGKLGFLRARTIRGRIAQLGHVMLYRSHQSRIHGFWRALWLWLVDSMNARLRATIRMD